MNLTGGEPTPEMIEEQNEFFAFVLESCLAEASCDSFTLWGASDKYSWVPVTFEGEGSATPWTDDLERKPAYYALYDILLAASGVDTDDPAEDADADADATAAADGADANESDVDAQGDADGADANVDAGAASAGTDADAQGDAAADATDGDATAGGDSADSDAAATDDTPPAEETPGAPAESPAPDTSGQDLVATAGTATPIVMGAAGLLIALGMASLIARRVRTQS